MSVVIQVENLSKYYRLGVIGGGTLREDLNRWWAKARGRHDPLLKIDQVDHGNRVGGELWALRDVSFQVREGEILGIIGRNGAGKSTLLKILSRITAPTSGQVKIKGRVGSLLEVGTGFHPELTGRENIYLNGAILGMKKAEIDRKLDEIIDFAEIEQFIDTPVKRYSSGMYVRLAFAVAAHLEPEILIVDEVLAVGDAAFQKKCLGKMGDVAKKGRTILFVSHNMSAVASLCSRCMVLQKGRLGFDGTVTTALSSYLQSGTAALSRVDLVDHPNRAAGMEPLLTSFEVLTEDGIAHQGRPLEMKFRYSFSKPIVTPEFCILFSTPLGVRVFTLISDYQENDIPDRLAGEGEVICRILSLPLMPSTYIISLRLWVPGQKLDDIENITQLSVEWLDRSDRHLKWTDDHGPIYVDAHWRMHRSGDSSEPFRQYSEHKEAVNV